MPPTLSRKVGLLTLCSLIAFASNSILTRAALSEEGMDAALFTLLRVGSGAFVLWLLVRLQRPSSVSDRGQGSWQGALALFFYALPFSLAYRELATGTGALLLFGMVQATMIVAGLLRAERPSPTNWLGMLLAAAGMVYLVLPGVEAPAPGAALMMALSGLAWGYYSIEGKKSGSPLRQSAGNFLRCTPIVLGAYLISVGLHISQLNFTTQGVMLALASGAVASGLGYALWYSVLPALQTTSAATLQLTVPIIAALGGVAFLAEPLSLRLLLAGGLVLGGTALALLSSHKSHS